MNTPAPAPGTTPPDDVPPDPRPMPRWWVFLVLPIAVGTVFGPVIGLFWAFLAPQAEYVVDASGRAVGLVDPAGRAFLGADLTLAGLGAATGIATTILLVRRLKEPSEWTVLGLVVGGLLGVWGAVVVGGWLTQPHPEGPGIVDGALHLYAWGLGLAWPLASVITYAVWVSWVMPRSGPLDPDDATTGMPRGDDQNGA